MRGTRGHGRGCQFPLRLGFRREPCHSLHFYIFFISEWCDYVSLTVASLEDQHSNVEGRCKGHSSGFMGQTILIVSIGGRGSIGPFIDPPVTLKSRRERELSHCHPRRLCRSAWVVCSSPSVCLFVRNITQKRMVPKCSQTWYRE